MKNNTHKKLAIYIGRFRPFHKGHLATIETALKENDDVLILVGSCGNPRNIKNPFTFNEIEDMIRVCFDAQTNSRIFIEPLVDHIYDNTKWITQVQRIVSKLTEVDEHVTLYGYEKDHSSYYLKFFPQWEFRNIDLVDNLHATDIRDEYFTQGKVTDNIFKMLPTRVANMLSGFALTDEFKQLQEEYNFIQNYKEAWKNAPYAPVFVTVDAVVECNGHILLIQRKHTPGKGLWAIPGGFLNQYEFIEDAMIRELKEETKINISQNMIRGSIKDKAVFDSPYRSLRGRTITHAYHVVLNTNYIPSIKANDDAMDAAWFPIATIMEMGEKMFEDHLDIISYFTKTDKIWYH